MILQRLRAWLRGETLVRECRHCGESVDGTRSQCPACGHQGIATYRLR